MHERPAAHDQACLMSLVLDGLLHSQMCIWLPFVGVWASASVQVLSGRIRIGTQGTDQGRPGQGQGSLFCPSGGQLKGRILQGRFIHDDEVHTDVELHALRQHSETL